MAGISPGHTCRCFCHAAVSLLTVHAGALPLLCPTSTGAHLTCSGSLEMHQERLVMRRFAVVVAFALMGVETVAGLSGHHALAQDATPVVTSGAEGITYLPLGY